MANVYSPRRHGAVQTAYHDRMATAAPGMLANVSDANFVDAAMVGKAGPDGLEAGLAVTLTPVAACARPGINQYAAALPESAATAADIAGVTVRGEGMKSNAAGNACWFEHDMCSVARTGRGGARIWVRLAEGASPMPDGAVFVHAGGENAGTFAASAGAGVIAVTTMIFRSAADNGLALVELL